MKITRITVFHKDLPLEHPYWLSGGRLKFEVLDATFVKIETDEGLTGWGEGTPWGHTYVPAHGPGIRAGIETMTPFVLGPIRAVCWMWNGPWTLPCPVTSMPKARSTWPAGTSQGKRRACPLPI